MMLTDSDASSTSIPEVDILLTVLIPTRNRSHRVVPLVKTFLSKWPARYRDRYEIVVLNNNSTDSTKVELAEIHSDKIRLINSDVYYPTSEENVFAGIGQAQGTFVWFFGDDDIPRFAALEALLDIIDSGEGDFFVSNFRVVDGDGRVASLSQVRGAPTNYFGRLSDIVTRVGMINMLSGWSIIVARRSMLDVSRAHEIRKVSPIYAHCFWFLSCFATAKAAFLTLPLVDYRVFHSTHGWSDYTKTNDVGYLYYWHLGLLRLLKMAMVQNLLTADEISKLYEYRHNGSKYRSVNEIAFKLIEQGDVYWKTKLERELLTRNELDEALKILTDIDLTLLDVSYRIRTMYEILWSSSSRNAARTKLYQEAQKVAVELLWDRNKDLYEPFFVEMIYGYCIYHYGDAWIGIRTDATDLIDTVFSQFTPRTLSPGVLISQSHSQLLNEIHWTDPTAEPVGVPPPPHEVSMLGQTDGSSAPQKEVESFESMIQERDMRVQELTGMVGVRDERVQQLTTMVGDRDLYIEKLTNMVGERDRYIQTLTGMVGERDAAYISLSEMVKKRGEAALWRRALRRLASA